LYQKLLRFADGSVKGRNSSRGNTSTYNIAFLALDLSSLLWWW